MHPLLELMILETYREEGGPSMTYHRFWPAFRRKYIIYLSRLLLAKGLDSKRQLDVTQVETLTACAERYARQQGICYESVTGRSLAEFLAGKGLATAWLYKPERHLLILPGGSLIYT